MYADYAPQGYGYAPAGPAVPATWAWDPFLQPEFAPPSFGFLGWGNPAAAQLAEDAASVVQGNVRSERQAVFAVANLFDRAAGASTTSPAAAAQLRAKAAMYREAIEAGAYDPTRTRVGIGQVGWRSAAQQDAAVYAKIVARYQRAIHQLRTYGAPRWIEVFDSAVVGTQARSDRVQEHTWDQAIDDTKKDLGRAGTWTLAALVPLALLAGGVWLALSFGPLLGAAWRAPR